MENNPFVNPSAETIKAINAMRPVGERVSAPISNRVDGPVIAEDTSPQDIARKLVFVYALDRLDPSDKKYATFAYDEVYVVQFFYILGNWKALVSTTLPDGMYYEVSYEKSRGVARLEAYKRFDHKEMNMPDPDGAAFENSARAAVSVYIRSLTTLLKDKKPVMINVYSFGYVFGSWKALLATDLDDGMYYEVTYDPHKRVAYLDPYKLFETKEFAIPARKIGD
jgi:hypothetical protein